MHNIRTLAVVLICLTLAACEPSSQRRLDRERRLQEKRLRSPTRIKEAEVVESALVQGNTIKVLLEQNSQADSTRCCPSTPAALLDSLETAYKASVSCYSFKEDLPVAASELEKQVFDAYLYNLEQQQPMEVNIQPDGKEYFIYTAPASNGADIQTSCAIWNIRLSRKQVVLEMLTGTAK